MEQSSQAGTPVSFTDREYVVIKEALRYILDEGAIPSGYGGEDVEDVLEQHLEQATNKEPLHVRPGMDEFYRTIFQEYASALQETVDIDEEGEEAESMTTFFESAFKSVVSKMDIDPTVGV